MMRNLSKIISVGTLLFVLQACRHEQVTIKTSTPVDTTVETQISGFYTWSGVHWFDGISNAVTDDTASIVALNDSQIMFSAFSPYQPLTYITTDSVAKIITFQFKWAPPALTWYYAKDSLHYSVNNGGIHSDDMELGTMTK